MPRRANALTPNEPEIKESEKQKTVSPRKRTSRPKEVRRAESGRPAAEVGSASKSRSRTSVLVKNSVDADDDSDRLSNKVEAATQLFKN